MSVVIGHDAIHANVSRLPPGQAAGYTTGSGDIPWTAADWKAHPGAVRICQDATASDHTADVLDVERGAATNGEAAGWFKAAEQSFDNGARPGQRSPAIYTSASNVTPLVNALITGGVRSGPGLWVANWNLTSAQAVADVENAAGPYPIIAVQYSSGQFYDTDVFSGTWLATVSGPSTAPKTWQTLTTNGHDSLETISKAVGTPAATILRQTVQKFGPFDTPIFYYLNHLADGTMPPTAPIGAGARLWVLR